MRIIEHDLDSLRRIVRELQHENDNLKALLLENNIPFDDRNVMEEEHLLDVYDEDQGARILAVNPTEAMAKVFYSYFWGRTDVYARRGKNGGYFPQCAGRWDNPSCPKRTDAKVFCDEDCRFKSWKPLELWMILQHLRGAKDDCSDVLGVYPLFPDNTCRFLVFDFDNHEKDAYKTDNANTDDLWKNEVDALRMICEQNGIDALVERSRSGRGAHLWIFFKSPVQAALARAFGFTLLDQGASSINLPSFKYYDRMYPSQDVLSKLGNLIALPLQGRALRNGNSAFIDHSWNAYPDQWKKLYSVKKLSPEELLAFVQRYNRDYITGKEKTKYAKSNMPVRPWRKDECFHKEDVIGEGIHVVLENGIYIDTLNLLPRLQNQIKALATIDNPEFYKNKALGRSNYYNLRTISVWNEDNGYIKIPMGMLEIIKKKAEDSSIKLDILDYRCHGDPIRVRFNGELRQQQEYAAAKLEKYEFGVLNAPTAFGKTVLAAYMVSQRKVNTLILLENTSLLPQWIQEFERFLTIDEAPPVYFTPTGRKKVRDSVIGTLKAGQDKTTGIIDFALIGSAYHKGAFFPKIDSYGMVLIDECHHIASTQGQALMQRIRAKYVYGLTATPNRSDRLDEIIYMLLGPVRHKYTAREQADAQGLERFVLPRFTKVVNISGEKLDIHKADELIATSQARNDQIVQDTLQAVENKRTPVILTKRKQHAEELKKLLEGKADHIFLIYGGQTEKQNQEIKEKMLSLPQSETMVLIATGQKIGEGFNFPRLDTLMLAAPIKFEGRLIQYVGRLNRIYEGKENVIVYDYVDSHIRFFDRQYKSRLAAYRKLGFKVISESGMKKQQANAIYDRLDYAEVFERDLVEANSEIVIASPGLRRNKVDRLITIVKSRQESGVTVTVLTLDPNDVGYEDTIELYILIEEMKKNGIFVRLTAQDTEHFAVIDHKLVWHGGMNLLGKADAWDNLIRVENAQAAAELLEMADFQTKDD